MDRAIKANFKLKEGSEVYYMAMIIEFLREKGFKFVEFYLDNYDPVKTFNLAYKMIDTGATKKAFASDLSKLLSVIDGIPSNDNGIRYCKLKGVLGEPLIMDIVKTESLT